MQAVTEVELKAVTPLFLAAGAHAPPEWRLPSLRGALRKWFRAACPTDHSNRNGVEHRVFGGAGEGLGQASVLLRVGAAAPPAAPYEWNKQRFRRDRDAGIQYLGYSISDREALPPRSQRALYLVDLRATDEDRRALVTSLWCIDAFGGLGLRSRRGFGSLQVQARTGDPRWRDDLARLPFVSGAASPREAADRIERGLAVLRSWWSWPKDPPPIPSLVGARCCVGPPAHTTWEQAMNAAGGELRSARFGQAAIDAGWARRVAERQGRVDEAPARVTFGMPLNFVKHRVILVPQHSDRHASPLHLHIAPNGSGFVTIWTLLGGPRPGFDPPATLRFQKKKMAQRLRPPPVMGVEDFFGKLRGHRCEVRS